MPVSRQMNAKLTTSSVGKGGSGYYTTQRVISQIYKSQETQDYLFYKILGNSSQAKRIANYPVYYQNYIALKRKYGAFTQNNSF